MKILLATSKPNSSSFCFYAASLSKLNGANLGASIVVSTDIGTVDFSEFEVALFMGGSNSSSIAKGRNENLLCGVVEPRSSQKNDFSNVDFVIANSLEAQDFFAGICQHSFLYYTYPTVPPKSGGRESKDLLLGYHGNKIHLESMIPRVTDAIRALHQEIPVRLYAMYNVTALGMSRTVRTEKLGFPVVHIDYSHENYGRYIAHVDIGLVPQLIPTKNSSLLRYLLGSATRKYNEKSDDFLIRYKETTNPGRHFVFFQYGIPVVSDMTPSACSVIDHRGTGYLACTTGGWFSALREMANSRVLRQAVGAASKNRWQKQYSPDGLNQRLIDELRCLRKARCGIR